jgi:Raf kinase inhibitor-like YbhB/YbcL family protein
MKNFAKVLLGVSVFLMSFNTPPTLTVTSSAFTAGGMIPAKYSCEGTEVSPPLTVTGMPAGTKSLAIILHDPDAGPNGFTHWVLWNIPANGNVAEDFKGAVQGLNGTGKPGYKGMCPPSGTHHYHFMVYALDAMLQLDATTKKADLEKGIQACACAGGVDWVV